MATKCSEEAILNFLNDRGGRVKNADLIEHFKAVFPEESEKKAAVHQRSIVLNDEKDIYLQPAGSRNRQGSLFTLLGPVQTGSTRQADTAPAGLSPTYRHVETRAERNRMVAEHGAANLSFPDMTMGSGERCTACSLQSFITGFTCLHWAAKQAFMHNHMEVVKLLVGDYNADIQIRDYSGIKACQYLTNSVSMDLQDIIVAHEQPDSQNTDHRKGGCWRLSKVLQNNLKPFMLLTTRCCGSR
ncbi:hypothetical protein Q8A73_022901 [Channa argus]|nr:hypothetical protein Q8A73_022901 [Channa argus]